MRLIFLVAALFAPLVNAASVTITSGGTEYSVGTVTGTYSDNAALLESQPWFTNDIGAQGGVAAQSAATQLGTQLGFANNSQPGFQNTGFGPLFVYRESSQNGFAFTVQDQANGLGLVSVGFGKGDVGVFAVATAVSTVPIPAAAWLFGSAIIGLGLMRKRVSDAI